MKDNVGVVAREHQKGVGEYRFYMYEGDIGVSSSEARDMAIDLGKFRPGRDITSLDVIDFLKDRVERRGFGYEQRFEEGRRKLREQFLVEARRQAESGGRNVTDMQLGKEIAEQVEKLIPVEKTADIVGQVEAYAKSQIQRDVKDALGLLENDPAQFDLVQYMYHVGAYVMRDDNGVPEAYLVDKGFSKGKKSPDDNIMKAFEDRLVVRKANPKPTDKPEWNWKGLTYTDRDKLRGEIFSTYSGWIQERQAQALPLIKLEDAVFDLPSEFREMYTRIREGYEKPQMRKIPDYLADWQKYGDNQKKLNADLISTDKTVKERAERWFNTNKGLVSHGYPPTELAREVIWAFKAPNMEEPKKK